MIEKYLTKRKQLVDKVIFDNESINHNYAQFTKENEGKLERILMPIFLDEIKKIKNGSSKLLTAPPQPTPPPPLCTT